MNETGKVRKTNLNDIEIRLGLAIGDLTVLKNGLSKIRNFILGSLPVDDKKNAESISANNGFLSKVTNQTTFIGKRIGTCQDIMRQILSVCSKVS